MEYSEIPQLSLAHEPNCIYTKKKGVVVEYATNAIR